MNKSPSTWSIARRIANVAAEYPGEPAISVNGETWTYTELLSAAQDITARMPSRGTGGTQLVTAIIADRSIASYVGILAAVLQGYTYVPIELSNPKPRNLAALRKSRSTHMICGEDVVDTEPLRQLLSSKDLHPIELITCGQRKDSFSNSVAPAPYQFASIVAASDIAYILFTSGSTGEPKGVPINYGNLTSYLSGAEELMGIEPGGCFSQTFELTFDPSIHDIFLCWLNGGHLVVPTRGELAKPAEYIRDHGITHWYSVPSIAFLIRSQGNLTAGAFPSLKSSLFCGEALPRDLALDWLAATPDSTVENWYGPTEATIVCARYVVPRDGTLPKTENNSVPIGKALPGMHLSIRDAELNPVPDGVAGELYLSGAQVATGYLDEPEKTAKRFVNLPGSAEIFYRTGDRAVRDETGNFQFLGRVDYQVKIRGYRVELGAIEAVLGPASGGANAVAFSWPPHLASGTSIVAVLETKAANIEGVIKAARAELPTYMVPSRIVCIETFPKNASGKIDRKAIVTLLEAQFKAASAPADENRDKSKKQSVKDRLLEAVLTVSPALDREWILSADSLIAAGMDSLSFISLTAEIETIYGLTLDQETVVALSKMSFAKMVEAIRAKDQPSGSATLKASVRKAAQSGIGSFVQGLLGSVLPKPRPRLEQRRANRALQFIERFPAFLETIERPIIPFIGSSGVYRGLSPQDFDEQARELGQQVHCLNIGLPAVSCAGLGLVCNFFREECQKADVKVPVAVYELDPMHICVAPPEGDIDLTTDHFSGRIRSQQEGELDPEFDWRPEIGGSWESGALATKVRRKPNWEKDRELEIARTYLGDMELVDSAIEEWLVGVEHLSQVADRVICFIHPADHSMTETLGDEFRGARLAKALGRISTEGGIEILPWQSFELVADDFLNINHVNPWKGRAVLSRQLARALFS